MVWGIALSLGKKFLSSGIGLALKYWKQALIIAFVGYTYYLHSTKIPNLQEEISLLSQANAQCELSRTELKESISMVNTQIDQWKQVSEGLQKQNDKLTSELVKIREQTKIKIDGILNQPTPKTCEEAIDFLRDMEDIQW